MGAVAGFFTYEDCGPTCAAAAEACTIVEVSPESFIATCFSAEEVCMSEATLTVVCIPPKGMPHGGEDIWPAYEAWRSHTTTTSSPTTTTTTPAPTTAPTSKPTTNPTTQRPTTTPSPAPAPIPSKLWWLHPVINTLVIALLAGAVIVIYRILKRRGYERIDLQSLPLMPEEDELRPSRVNLSFLAP